MKQLPPPDRGEHADAGWGFQSQSRKSVVEPASPSLKSQVEAGAAERAEGGAGGEWGVWGIGGNGEVVPHKASASLFGSSPAGTCLGKTSVRQASLFTLTIHPRLDL